MTLQQAHELQRRELISLRARVARLEKQTTVLFPVVEKETLERHIRHLEQVNNTEKRRHEVLSHPEIDYTNNISERQLRKFK